MLEPVQGAFFQVKDKIQILPHRHVQIERGLLGQIPDAGFRLVGLFEDVVSIDFDRALAGGQVAGEDVHGRGLAGAVRPQEAEDLPFFHLKADMVYSHMGPIPLGQVLYLDHMLRIPPSRVPSGGSRTVYNAYIVPDGARGFVNSL